MKRYNFLGLSSILLMVIFFSKSCSPKESNQVDLQHKKEISTQLYKIRKDKDSLNLFLERSVAQKDEVAILYSHRLLGNYYRENTNFSKAIDFHQKELEIAYKLLDTIDIIQALNNLGTDFRRLGALAEASTYHYQALDYADKFSIKTTVESMKNRVIAINGLGNIALTLGYLEEAMEYFQKALIDEIKLESHIGQAINYANIGSIFEQKELLDSAYIYYNRSLEHNMQAKSNIGIALCNIHLGDLYKKEKRYDLAREQYQMAYELMEDISDRWHWLGACISIAEIHLLTNQRAQFEHYLNLAEKIATQINSTEHLSTIYDLRHNSNLLDNNYKEALVNYKKSIAMQESVQGIKNSNQFIDQKISYERARFNRNIKEIEAQHLIDRQKKEMLLYALLLASFFGVIITAIIYYAYRQRTKSNRALQDLERMRSQFFTGITHEFRTPLTIILGLAEQIESKINNGQAKEIMHQGALLLELVNQLLELAKIRSQVGENKWVRGDVVAVIEMTMESLKNFASTKNRDLTFLSHERFIIMDFLPNYLEKIIVNLLSNAIKHTSDGGKINLSLSKSNETLCIRVSDNGKGIDPVDLPFIFEEFYIGKDSNHNFNMSGIGLALVKKMVLAMNGSISANNIKAGGAEFIVNIPIKQNFEVTEEWGGALNKEQLYSFLLFDDHQGESLLSVDSADSPIKPTLLVVEDNQDIQNYIGSLFSERYNLRTASNGEEALSKASEFVPDLIITDLMMPIMDGLEFLKKVRSSYLLNHIPVIIVSAKSTDEERLSALRDGADVFLSKPFNSRELLLRVEKLLEQREVLRNKFSNALFEKNSERLILSKKESDFVNRVTALIHERISDCDLNADEIADRLYLSRSQLDRKTRQISGYSISALILHIRLERSKQMLREETFLIGDIASACGFDDPNYYSRLFKRYYKITPSEYRRLPKGV